MRFIAGLVIVALAVASAVGQTTYTWKGGSAAWTTATNWDPVRNSPAASDILQFNDGNTVTVSSVPSQTIGEMVVSGNTSVTFLTNATNTLVNAGGSGTALYLQHGSSLIVSGANALTISLSSGAIASIAGAMTFAGGAHKLLAADAGSIIVNSGSVITQGGDCSGYLFGNSGTANVIDFVNGSTFVSQAGGNPFGLSSPKSKVTFHTGSLYSHEQTGSLSFSGRTFADFQLNCMSANINGIGSNPLSIDNLTVAAGTLNLGMTGTFSLNGNIAVASGGVLNFNPGSTASLTFSGSSSQSISNSGNLTFQPNQSIEISNTSGVNLESDITVNGSLAFSNGNLNTGSNTLTLGPTATISGEASGKYVVGNLVKTEEVGVGASSSMNSIGVGLEAGGGDDLGTVTVTRISGTDGIVHNPSNSSKQGIARKWIVTSDNPPSSGRNLTLSWISDDDNGKTVTQLQNMVVYKSTNDGESWSSVGFAQDGSSRSVTVETSSFSQWTVSDLTDNPLPVTLKGISARVVDGQIELTLSTATELGTVGFNIYRSLSKDGPFEMVSSYTSNSALRSAGTSTTGASYTFADSKVTEGNTYYYKIESVTTSGLREDVGGIIEVQIPVRIPRECSVSQNYPNPFNPTTAITYRLAAASHVTLQVFDVIGRSVTTLVDRHQAAGEYRVSFDGSGLPSGVYYYRLRAAGDNGKLFVRAQRMMLVK